MQITRAADYAVRVSIHLAALPPGVKAQRADLAEATGTPSSFLSKVLQRLVQRGLVSSSRGATGGFELSWGRSKMTVLDVVEAIEGRTQLNVCLGDGPTCDRKTWCPGHPVWREAQNALVQVLGGALIANLAKEAVTNPTLVQLSRAQIAARSRRKFGPTRRSGPQVRGRGRGKRARGVIPRSA